MKAVRCVRKSGSVAGGKVPQAAEGRESELISLPTLLVPAHAIWEDNTTAAKAKKPIVSNFT